MTGLGRGEEGRRPIFGKSWDRPNRFIFDGKGRRAARTWPARTVFADFDPGPRPHWNRLCQRPVLRVVGLDTPGPASAGGVLSAEGSTNFVHPNWAGFDIRETLAKRLRKPVTYLNDGNAGALWGHFAIFGANNRQTSISAIIGTGLGGGVIIDGNVVKGRKGFGGELGHVLIPYQSIVGIGGLKPECNCGRTGDLESMCSLTAIEKTLLPFLLVQYPDHKLGKIGDLHQAAKLVRGLAESGDPMCKEILRVQAHALGLFFDEMVNTFDPDALIVGGGALETKEEFQRWFIDEIRAGMPTQREEQADIPVLSPS